MLRPLLLSSALMLAPLLAQAQTGDQAAGGKVGTTETSGNIASPAEEAGWTVIRFPNGYLRYRSDDASEQAGEEGSFIVVPAVKEPPAASAPQAQAPATGAALEPAIEAPAPATASCQPQADLLAHRLLQLRGIEVDPTTASLVLSQIEVPLSPFIVRTMNGLGTSYVGGSLLSSAISYDLETQQLAAQLAHCLAQ